MSEPAGEEWLQTNCKPISSAVKSYGVKIKTAQQTNDWAVMVTMSV